MHLTTGPHYYYHNGHTLRYRFQRGQSDRLNLLVIFSGFRKKGTLDFGGDAISPIRTNILWIYDEFGFREENAYYLLEGGKFGPREIVDNFIDEVRRELGLEFHNLTYAGFSKGGTAAIYFGLRHQVGAIITTVPQFYLGSYAKKNWPKVFDFMRDKAKDPNQQQSTFDALLPECLAQNKNSVSHLYIFTSRSDAQFPVEIEPNLPLLQSLPNFNLIISESPLITEHINVTPYNVPDLLALFQLAADALFPHFGTAHISHPLNHKAVETQQRAAEGVAILEKCSTSNTSGQIELEMATFVRGHSLVKYEDLDRALILYQADGNFTRLPLGKLFDKLLSRRHLQDTFIDYSGGLSVSPQRNGFPLEAFPYGQCQALIELALPGQEIIYEPLVSKRRMSFHHIQNDSLLSLRSDTTETVITKYDLKSMRPAFGSFLRVDTFESDGATLRTQGWFAPIGTRVTQWNDATMYLVAEEVFSREITTSPLGLLDRGDDLSEDFPFAKSMRKSYFNTAISDAHDFSGLSNGEYVCKVLFVNDDVTVMSEAIGRFLMQDGQIIIGEY